MGIQPTYQERNEMRQNKLNAATMAFVGYFIGLGDDQASAQAKVAGLSTECAAYLYPYVLGNTQPLKDAIQASSLVYMDQAAKDFLINELSA